MFQQGFVLQSVPRLTLDTLFQPPGVESKIPEIGVNLFCLEIVLTEFHVSNSIGIQIPIQFQIGGLPKTKIHGKGSTTQTSLGTSGLSHANYTPNDLLTVLTW